MSSKWKKTISLKRKNSFSGLFRDWKSSCWAWWSRRSTRISHDTITDYYRQHRFHRELEDELLFSLSNSKGDILVDIYLIEGLNRKNLEKSWKNYFSWMTLDLSLLPNTCSIYRPQTSVFKLGSTLPMILKLLLFKSLSGMTVLVNGLFSGLFSALRVYIFCPLCLSR